jgi:poly(hydroxyalkanoate) depolymerase family esterase
MNATLQAGMLEATRLTRAGQLLEATAIIQRTLRGLTAPQAEADAPSASTPMTIDGECRVVGDEPVVMQALAGEPQPCPVPEPAVASAEAKQYCHSRAGGNPNPCAAENLDPRLRGDDESTQPIPDFNVDSSLAFGAGLHERLRQQWRKFRGPRPGSAPLPEQAPAIVPDGARFITGSYTNQAGTRSYKLYIPSGYHGQPLPLVVMLHGCTQNPDDFAVGTGMNALAEEQLCFVAYPAQTHAANGSKCWNWFKSSDQQRDGGEPSIIAGLTRQIVASHRVDARRIYVAGLSAGGAMAATMAMTYPELYAAAGIHSGLPHAVAQDLPSALAAMQGGGILSVGGSMAGATHPGATPVPTIVFHGDRDATVHPCNGEKVIAQSVPSPARPEASPDAARPPRVTVEPGQVPDGHDYTRTTYHDASGQPIVEHWLIHGAGHAWSGGSPRGSYTDPKGPDAAQEMLRFFYEHPQGEIGGRVS